MYNKIKYIKCPFLFLPKSFTQVIFLTCCLRRVVLSGRLCKPVGKKHIYFSCTRRRIWLYSCLKTLCRLSFGKTCEGHLKISMCHFHKTGLSGNYLYEKKINKISLEREFPPEHSRISFESSASRCIMFNQPG